MLHMFDFNKIHKNPNLSDNFGTWMYMFYYYSKYLDVQELGLGYKCRRVRLDVQELHLEI